MKVVKKVGFVGRSDNILALETAKLALRAFSSSKTKVVVASEFFRHSSNSPLAKLSADIILAFGGDGTILHVFRERGKDKTPVLGINCGERGFLTAVSYKDVCGAITNIVSGDFHIEERSRIECIADGEQLPLALNEAVIAPEKSAVVMNFEITVGKEKLFSDSSDALLVSTPTGSTGYSFSAEGPRILSGAKVLLISSLHSLQRHNKVVVPDSKTIKITNMKSKFPCEVVLDGQFRRKVSEKVELKKSLFSAFTIVFSLTKKDNAKEVLKELPSLTPSAKLLLSILSETPLTSTQLAEKSVLSRKTVYNALDILIAKKLVKKRSFSGDKRKSHYSIACLK